MNRFQIVTLFLLILFSLIGCKSKTEKIAPTPEKKVVKAEIETVEFKAGDDLDIYGDLIKGDTDKAVICVHMFPGSRRDYRKLMPKLADKGYTVLSIDTRGCPKGDTGRDKYQDLYQKFSPDLFKIVYKDVLAAKNYLVEKHKISKDKIGLIGGSIGCSVVLMSAVEDDSFKNIVLMSPGIDWADIDNLKNMKKLGTQNVLITYGKEENGYKDNIDKLVKAATEDTKITVHPLDGNAHAGYQFEKNPEVIELIVKFISDNLK